jgi:hypothetical protein
LLPFDAGEIAPSESENRCLLMGDVTFECPSYIGGVSVADQSVGLAGRAAGWPVSATRFTASPLPA